jgi:membrane protease YdiL (CAAX protease family)
MRIRGGAKSYRLLVKNADLKCQPYWGYEDIGAFFLVVVLFGLILRLLARIHFLSRSAIINPSIGLQSGVVVCLGAGLYSILRLRYRQPVLKPLGWVVPRMIHIATAVLLGPAFATGIALYLRLRNQITPPIPIAELLVLGFILGPLLEESLFRGCVLPILAQTTGTIPAVIITAVMFAFLHGPTNLVHWVTVSGTGIAYGWMRVASRSTTAPAVMHAAYNLTLGLLIGV